MKRVFAAILGLALTFALAMPVPAYAEHIKGNTGWYTEYTNANRMEDNYTQKSWADNMSQLQPGDDITLTVEIRHSNDSSADWYLSNEVLKSLEEGDATGSAYGYKLTYEGTSGSKTLYESESIGGTGSAKGLGEATNAMDAYFFLDNLSKGQTGKVKLNVSLDGETEGNAYFDTLAQLKLKFAVEPDVETPPRQKVVEHPATVYKSERIALVQTGDQTTLFPVYLAIAGVGLVCLALGIRNVRNKEDKKEGEKR